MNAEENKQMKDVEITIIQATEWVRALNAARWTVNLHEVSKTPSESFKINVMMPQHSPIRMVEYDIKVKHIPYCFAVHFIRHHIGVEKFQCTLRDDRNNLIDDRKKLPQDQPVNLWIACNADSLIAISRKRLCGMASPETRGIWESIKEEMKAMDPTVARFMVKECTYRGFCPEDPHKSCKYVKTLSFKNELEQYRDGFIQNEL